MYVSPEEMNTVIYRYQVNQITEGDELIVYNALAVAEEQVKSYLRPNNSKGWNDGRPRYDVDVIFSKRGNERSPALMNLIKTLAVWALIDLANVDIIFDHAESRYNSAVKLLESIRSGFNTLDLPLSGSSGEEEDEDHLPFYMGSRAKFNHE